MLNSEPRMVTECLLRCPFLDSNIGVRIIAMFDLGTSTLCHYHAVLFTARTTKSD